MPGLKAPAALKELQELKELTAVRGLRAVWGLMEHKGLTELKDLVVSRASTEAKGLRVIKDPQGRQASSQALKVILVHKARLARRAQPVHKEIKGAQAQYPEFKDQTAVKEMLVIQEI